MCSSDLFTQNVSKEKPFQPENVATSLSKSCGVHLVLSLVSLMFSEEATPGEGGFYVDFNE